MKSIISIGVIFVLCVLGFPAQSECSLFGELINHGVDSTVKITEDVADSKNSNTNYNIHAISMIR